LLVGLAEERCLAAGLATEGSVGPGSGIGLEASGLGVVGTAGASSATASRGTLQGRA
jgi:hypothetical protein